jgi:hypothetical protein
MSCQSPDRLDVRSRLVGTSGFAHGIHLTRFAELYTVNEHIFDAMRVSGAVASHVIAAMREKEFDPDTGQRGRVVYAGIIFFFRASAR